MVFTIALPRIDSLLIAKVTNVHPQELQTTFFGSQWIGMKRVVHTFFRLNLRL